MQEMINRKIKDVSDAVSKLPTNHQILAEFAIDKTFPVEDRIDFLYTLARIQHPSILFILRTLRDRDEGQVSAEAIKILKNYSVGDESRSYNNISEALSELPPPIDQKMRLVIYNQVEPSAYDSIIQELRDSGYPAARFILRELGHTASALWFGCE